MSAGGAQADVVKPVGVKTFISGGHRWKRVQSLNQTSNLCLVVVAVKDCLHLAPPPPSRQPYIMNPPESRWTQSDLCKVTLYAVFAAAEPHLVLVSLL